MFYVCARSRDERGGILAFDSGSLEQLAFLPLRHASYLAFSPDRKRLYAACEDDEAGAVATFALDETGLPHFEAILSAPGFSGCHLIAEKSGKFLYAANYGAGNFAEFRLQNGVPLGVTRMIQHHGHGPNAERQEKAHVHFVQLTPDGRYLCVIDLGIDEIVCYALDSDGVRTDDAIRFKVTPAGSGPRHLVFSRAGDRAYLLNELENTVMTLGYRDGRFTQLGVASSLPPEFSIWSKAAAIRLSPDERFVLASNRGYDTIAVFERLGDELKLRRLAPSGGKSPRDFNFINDRLIAVANESTDNLVFFGYDPRTGALIPRDGDKRMVNPLCVFC